jgi:hypothetical protein
MLPLRGRACCSTQQQACLIVQQHLCWFVPAQHRVTGPVQPTCVCLLFLQGHTANKTGSSWCWMHLYTPAQCSCLGTVCRVGHRPLRLPHTCRVPFQPHCLQCSSCALLSLYHCRVQSQQQEQQRRQLQQQRSQHMTAQRCLHCVSAA